LPKWVRRTVPLRENCHSLRVNLARIDEKTSEAEVKMPEYHQAHQGAARQQQDGLGNLHPGGCLHSANRDIDDHQDANAGDCIDIVSTKKELDELSRADHLGNKVEQYDHKATGRRDQPHRGSIQTKRRCIGKREAAQVAQPLGHQEQHDRPACQKAERINEAVKTCRIDERGEAEKRRRGKEVARDRQSIL
jgi:hypothetical protein